jgi:ferrous iron transport protein B
MQRLGLPGKSFVPLIVGFGCNVPSVMATRTLDNEPDRILTTIMAPYMSCGARLTVYALFAAAFFPSNGQNVVFSLYLLGILVAVLSALAVRRYLLPRGDSHFLMELPEYHWPTLRGLLLQTWQRLRSFVLRAGKAIVAVVVVLNGLNSLGMDGSFGNENTERSALSAVGKKLTPLFEPMGVQEDNWPATVGIFTGFFAKEVVVGTLDALYSPNAETSTLPLTNQLRAAFATVPDNLAALAGDLDDPLGLDLGELQDTEAVTAEQEISLTTLQVLQRVFDGPLGAFSYLVFILLYMPCVATIGVIYKEIGAFWAGFSSLWSLLSAYGLATLCYQAGQLSTSGLPAMLWIAGVCAIGALGFWLLIYWGQQRRPELIPLVRLE